MDALEYAALNRARTALDTMADSAVGRNQHQQAKAFVDLALMTIQYDNANNLLAALKRHGNPVVRKAVAESTQIWSELWGDGNISHMASAYLATIAEQSILDQIKKYARVLPRNLPRIMIASDAVGDLVAEGDPKPVKNLTGTTADAEYSKSAAIIVMTKELALVGGPELRRLFEVELEQTVARATNKAVLAALINSNTATVQGTGDVLTDLRAGLRAAEPSYGYVVAAPAADVRDLATRVENRGGMSVRGGTFVPGVEVVAIDDATDMQIIPASRIVMLDDGVRVRTAEHASLDMRDTPQSPAQMVSLWQTNCLGLLIERSWDIAQGAEVVVVESGS
ncbi:hypothetical protein LMG26691_04498 [Achromobacter animicus]|nr:hypothetical protein LMG26691_04498 [Achromobacter animicus]